MAEKAEALGEPADASARELIAALGAGRIGAAEVARSFVARIEAGEGALRAFAHFDLARVMAEAEERDRRRRAGMPLGPLHGLPVAVKDIIDVRGYPCEFGTELEAGRRPTADAAVAGRLRGAGAVVLGKTVTAEFASIAPGATRNPHDPERTPGGSSSGSAAAVAAGMAPFALGTQTLGSVIRPASFCGCVGFKPSFDAIPRAGVMADAPSLDHVGVFARSIEDAALAEHLMPGGGPGPLSGTALSEPPLAPAFAFVRSPVWDRAEPATQEAFGELAAALGDAVEEVELPAPFAHALDWTRRIMAAEMAHGLGRYADTGRTSAEFAALIAEGRAVPATDYLVARDWQLRLRAGLGEVFDRFDAILTPAAPGEAPGRETTGDGAFCALWSLTGLPALSLPLLTGPAALPVGVQLVGAYGGDARLLRSARWLVRRLGEGD